MAYKVVERRAALLCPICGKPLSGSFVDRGTSVVAVVICHECKYVQPIAEIVTKYGKDGDSIHFKSLF